MEYFKLQMGCLAVVFFIVFIYLKENGVKKNKRNYSLFTAIYITAILFILFDGITAYTVNYLDWVNYKLNLVLHLCFL